ncbi:MAG: ABC transporter ATP-binding protein [Planctomycetota bacterium]
MIQCTNVKKSYAIGGNTVEALKGVDLIIERAGFYAIMGASGSGKSTLLHLLAGIDSPDTGEIIIGERRIDQLNERELTMFRRSGVGIVFQQFNLIPTMTAVENVELPGILAGERGGKLRPRAMELLDRLGLADRAGHRPQAMSGGEQQRVAIARSLLFHPPVILADEPTGNLDSSSSESLWALLAELATEQEVTVVMVTHEPAAAAHCERTFLLRDGVVAGTIETRSNGDALDASGLAAEYQRLVGA